MPSVGQNAMPMLASELTGTPATSTSTASVRCTRSSTTRALAGVDAREHEAELVAAEAGERVARPEHLGERRGDVPQVGVAVVVAERVVHFLEAVEVDDRDPDRFARPARRRDRVRDAVAEQRAVRQAGEEIVQRHVLVGRGAAPQPAGHRPADPAQRQPQRDQAERDQDLHRAVRRRERVRDRRVRQVDLEHADHVLVGAAAVERDVRLDRARPDLARRRRPSSLFRRVSLRTTSPSAASSASSSAVADPALGRIRRVEHDDARAVAQPEAQHAARLQQRPGRGDEARRVRRRFSGRVEIAAVQRPVRCPRSRSRRPRSPLDRARGGPSGSGTGAPEPDPGARSGSRSPARTSRTVVAPRARHAMTLYIGGSGKAAEGNPTARCAGRPPAGSDREIDTLTGHVLDQVHESVGNRSRRR